VKPWRAAAQRHLRRLGAPGVAAIGVGLFCAVAWLSAVVPLQERRAAASARLAQHNASPPGAPQQVLQADLGLEAFYAFFGRGKTGSDWLEALHGLARESGLDLLQGNYRYSQQQGERLARYEITLPARGSYAQIRRFLAAVLNEVPVASLDQVAFEKKRVGDAQIEAQLRLTLFLHAGEPEKEKP
jgi:hypothetical protein